MSNITTTSPPPMQVPASFTKDKQMAAFFNSLISTIYQLWTSEYSSGVSAKVNTTDNTQTSMLRISVKDGTTTMIDANIVARADNGDSAFYSLKGAYKNIGGTLTGIGSPNIISGEDVAGWNVGLSSSGTYAIVTVIGAPGTPIAWEGDISAYTVGV